MTDIRKHSIAPNSPSATHDFRIGSRVQVENLVDGKPGPFHACRGIITMLLKSDEGEPAAKIMFSGRIEKKLLLTKLIFAAPTARPEPPIPAPSTRAPALPSWADDGCVMVRGDQLRAGDRVYFNKIAQPRELQTWVRWNTWLGVTIAMGSGSRIPGTFMVDGSAWYVVLRG